MTTQTRRVTEQPLNVVLRPDSPAEAAYRERRPRTRLRARTRARTRVPRRQDARALDVHASSTSARWPAAERRDLDRALAGAMRDPG